MCNDILDIDTNIQSVAIINNKGRVIEKASKPTFADLFPADLDELFCMQQVLQISMGRDFNEKYGPINYYISERASFTTLTFPAYDGVILVTATKGTSIITLAERIISTLEEQHKLFQDQ